MYRVLLLNDDYTPMEFVVGVLCTFFHKDPRGRRADHVAGPHQRRRGMRYLYLRGCRHQGDAGHGSRAQASASAAMRHGKEVRSSQCRPSRAISNRPSIALWPPPFGTTPRIRDPRTSSPEPARRRRRGGGDARLFGRSRDAAQESGRLYRARTRQSRDGTPRGPQADLGFPAGDPARRDPRAVVRPRGGDGRQRAGRDLRRAREPRRLFPARAGHDPLRRGQLHQPRHRQASRHATIVQVRARRRGGGKDRTRRDSEGSRQQEEGSARSRPIASTSTTRRATAASIR